MTHYLYWKVTAVSECPSDGHDLLVVSSAQFCAVLWSLPPGGLHSYNSIFIIFCPLLVLYKAMCMLHFYGRTNLLVRTFIRNKGEAAWGHSPVLPILELCYWFHKSLRRHFVLTMVMAALSSAPKAHAYNSTHAKVLRQMREYPSKLVCSLNMWKAVKFLKSCEASLEIHSTGGGERKKRLWRARVLHLTTYTKNRHLSTPPGIVVLFFCF